MNRRFASWMCSRQICSNCVMLSCQYGPKSLRNVSNTLLNLCHEELRQFWMQKWIQPSTSKVYLIKWPMSVYTTYRILTKMSLHYTQYLIVTCKRFYNVFTIYRFLQFIMFSLDIWHRIFTITKKHTVNWIPCWLSLSLANQLQKKACCSNPNQSGPNAN